MVNNHFSDDTLNFVRSGPELVDSVKNCLDTFRHASSAMVSDYKSDF